MFAVKRNALLFLFVLLCISSIAQPDTSRALIDTFPAYHPEAEGAVYSMALGTLMIAFACVFFGTVLAVCILILGCFALVILAVLGGLFSVSLLNGIRKRSVSSVFTTFFWMVIPLLSAILSVFITWLLSDMLHWGLSASQVLVYGIGVGLLAGLLSYYVLAKTVKLILRLALNKIKGT